jgi:hypothetical protein
MLPAWEGGSMCTGTAPAHTAVGSALHVMACAYSVHLLLAGGERGINAAATAAWWLSEAAVSPAETSPV